MALAGYDTTILVAAQQEAMATKAQREAARKNIKKARKGWQGMSPEERARAQPHGGKRAKPGSSGEGDYFHVMVRDKNDFDTFRTHDVGDEGHVQRVAGQRPSGSWDTVKWLIEKEDAHVEKGRLVPDTEDAEGILEQLGSTPQHIEGDRFKAKPRPNVPEQDKPTEAQQKARRKNIKKAQEARHD